MAAVDRSATVVPASDPAPPPHSARLIQIGAGLAVALAIVAGAWFVVGRSGFDSLGQGGINQSLLPKAGRAAPDFETENLLGETVRLSDFRGRPVWLMFWGSWCPPCRAEFPEIQAAYAQLKPEGVELLGVSLREPTLAAAAYAAQNDAAFTVLSDPNETDTGAAYPVYNFPTHIFIDAEGVIRSIVLEPMDADQAIREGRALLQPPTADSR